MEIIKVIKKSKLINIIISFIVIIICFINFYFNKNIYMAVLTNNFKQIYTLNDINNNDEFYYIDLSMANKNKYNLKNDKETYNMYSVSIENNNILILLKENTIPTNKTIVRKLDTDNIILQLNDKFQKSDYKYIFTDMDLQNDIKVELYKSYFIVIIIFILIISILLNFIGFINPTKTHKYKKYKKDNLVDNYSVN